MADKDRIVVERVQTGIRIEKRLLKVLKGLAEYLDLTLGDLVEGIVLHAFDGEKSFFGRIPAPHQRPEAALLIWISIRRQATV